MRAIAIVFAVLALGASPLHAQNRGSLDAQQRWAENQEMMNASDPILRWEGLNRALADENPGVRNNALWAFLRKKDRLPLEIVLPPGSGISPGGLPNVEITNITWNEDQRALQGRSISFGNNTVVAGQVAGGRLRLHYERLAMPTSLGERDTTTARTREIVSRACSVVFAVNAARDGLEGKFQCEGTSLSLPIQMPLG